MTTDDARRRSASTARRGASGETRARLLDAAEAQLRAAGYHGVSTRDIAAAVGIRAASAHHHFPTKIALALAVIERYQARFLEALGPPERFSGDQSAAIAAYGSVFAESFEREGRLCLCGVLGAERQSLPEPLAAATGAFFRANLTWLEAALAAPGADDAASQRLAAQVLAQMEGAMLLANALADPSVFQRAVDAERSGFVRSG
ncbi:MAG: TetR/AcrR family transcriptional regulator [Pseudomonadota bacterium]